MNLKENVDFFYDNKYQKLIITCGVHQYKILDPKKKYLKMMKKENFSGEMLEFVIKNNLIDVLPDQMDQIIKNDRTCYFFRDKIRSQLFDQNLQPLFKRIKNEKFLVIGCGGIGTVILDNLIRVGFRNFTLIDGDKVEANNLNRQLFYTKENIGEYKVDVLSNKMKLISDSDDVNIITLKKFIKSKEEIETLIQENQAESLMVINCADTPCELNNIIGKITRKYRIPFVFGYVGIDSGTWGPVYDEKKIYKEQDLSKTYPIKGSLGATNMIVGSLLSYQVVSYVLKDYLDIEENYYNQHVIDFDKGKILINE